jgi:catechol 2,3-dioxygenase-like lactoylglutathione lyase family enzyme
VATNVDFWCRVLGLRFVKNTLNFETMFRYHTYFGHEEATPTPRRSRTHFLAMLNGRAPQLPKQRPRHGPIAEPAREDPLSLPLPR